MLSNLVPETKNDVLLGINLGADYTAEHEWGIDGLKQSFKIKDEGLGIEKRRIEDCSKVEYSEKVKTVKKTKTKEAVLFVNRYGLPNFADRICEDGELNWPCYFNPTIPKDLVTAWSEDDFGIRVRNEEVAKLNELYQEFKKKNVAVWVGGGHVFQNGGLIFGIIDRIPEQYKQQMYDSDLDRQNLNEAAEKTGIKKKLEDADKGKRWELKEFGFYALSPRWAKERKEIETQYPVIFWLNPNHQDRFKAGYFSVENLKDWMLNKGPIIKKS